MTLHRFKAALVASLILLLCATEAVAQRTGTRIGRTAQAGNVADAELAMSILARCVANRRQSLLQAWFATLPGSREETALLQRQTDDMSLCLDDDRLVMDSRALRFQPASLRRPVALALVESGISRAPEEAPIDRGAEPWFVAPFEALAEGSQVDRGALVLQDFGHCVVLAAWRDARGLFMTRSGSTEENAAVQRLMPSLGPCLAEGVTINVTRRNLRLILAEPFHQIVTASSAAAGN